jgi:hypothetical protein
VRRSLRRPGVWHRIALSGLSVWLSVLAVACGQAAALDGGQVPLRIIVYPLDGTVRAAYRLGQPTTHFRFAQALDAIRSRTWVMKTPGLTLDHDQITADNGSPFREFTIAIKPDETAADRVYPALFRLGPEGLALYTPYLAGDLAAWQSFVQPKLPANSISLAGAEREIGVFGMLGVDRYVYLGPQDYVHRRDAVFVVAPDLPGWIAELAEARFDRVREFYETRLGWTLPVTPMVLMAYADMPGPSRYRGDVSSGWIMALRFHGTGWHERVPDDSYDITHLIAHESFHLWNGMLFNSRQLGEQPWLHEGSAEYAALLALRQFGELSDEAFRDDLETRLNRCETDLGAEPLNAGGRVGHAAYDCGVIVQWIADVATHRSDGPGRDFFTLWHDLFQTASSRQRFYTVEDFEQALPPQARPAIDLILTEGGRARWNALPARLKALGIDLTPPGADVTDNALRHRAVLHLLNQACGADRHGFVTEPGFVQLDTGPGCGPLADDPSIISAEGHDLLRDMLGAFAAIVKKCGSAAPVLLGGATVEQNFAVICPKPLPVEPRSILGGTGLP